MKITALYKTAGSSDIIEASLTSIYDRVSRIVIAHSDVGWDGARGGDVLERIRAWAAARDQRGKIDIVRGEWWSQLDQYHAGIRRIRAIDSEREMTMLVDADEVWFPEDIDYCIRYMDGQPTHLSFSVRMHTYLRDPHFQVEPAWGTPCAFVREPEFALCGARGERAPVKNLIPTVHMHHFTMVIPREQARAKILRSWIGDDDYGAPPNPDRWLTEVWDRLPEGENLHYFPRHATAWSRVRVVSDEDLPPTMRERACSPP